MSRNLSQELTGQLKRTLRPWVVGLIREATGDPVATPAGTGSVQAHSYTVHSGTIPDGHAPQFLKTDGARNLDGDLGVDTGVTIDGVDLDVHAGDPDAHHDKLHSIIDPLHHTTGGDGQYRVLWQPTAGTIGWTESSDDVAAGGIRILRSTVQGGLTLYRLAAALEVQTPKVYATGDLTLSPGGGDVFVDTGVAAGTADYQSQLTGWRITHAGAGDFRYLYADEMHVKAFIADLEQALAGGQIIAKSVAVLQSTFTAPAEGAYGYLVVRDLPSATGMAVFQDNDIVRLRTFSRAGGSLSVTDCWGTVTLDAAYGSGGFDAATRTQRYLFQRSTAPNAGGMSAGATVEPDALVLDYGTSGSGLYEVNAIDGVYGANSPYARFITWTGHPATGSTVAAQLGKLSGLAGIGQPGEFGLYIRGKNAADYVLASPVQGINLVAAGGSVFITESGGIDLRAADTAGVDYRAYTFTDASSQVVAKVACVYSLNSVETDIISRQRTAGKTASLRLEATHDVTGFAYLAIRVDPADPSPRQIQAVADAVLFTAATSVIGSFGVTGNATIAGAESVTGAHSAASYSTANWASFNGGLITVQYTSAPYHGVSIRANTGSAWARSFGFNDGANNLGGFGAYGPSGGLEHWYIGPSYGASAHVFVRRSDGYVAVGNNTPQDRLHVSGAIIAQAYRATLDTPGALTAGVAMTGAYQGVSTGTGTVRMGGATNHNSTHWLKFYAGSTAVYVPAWDNIS